MDIGKAFTFMGEDSDWLMKLGIGVAITLSSYFIGFTAIILVGYQVAVARFVIEGKDSSLPSWDDFGKILIDSLVLSIVRFIYYLPAICLFFVGFFVMIMPLIAIDGEPTEEQILAAFTIPFCLLSCLMIIYATFVSFLNPIITLQYIKTGDFLACFRLFEILGLVGKHFGDILLIVAALFGASIATGLIVMVSSITVIGPFILGLFIPIWMHVARGHLAGQLGRKMAKLDVADYAPQY